MRADPRSAIVGLAACIAVASCSPAPSEVKDRFFALGTVVELTLYDVDPRLAAAAGALARERLDLAMQRWSPTMDGGELAELNQALRERGQASLTPMLAAEVARSLALSESSGGRFDPAIGGLVALWGFQDESRADGPPPSEAEIAALLAHSPFHRQLTMQPGGISATAPVQLDLGGFAKGLAAADLADALRALGVCDGIVNLGGDLVALGRHGDRPWRVAIRDPRAVAAIAALDVSDGEAVFTSGDYERGFEYRGRWYHHILDPATGYPSTGLRSVTVVHTEADLADAAATALMVAGPQHWREVAAAMGVALVMVVDDQGGIGMTDAMTDRIELINHAPAP